MVEIPTGSLIGLCLLVLVVGILVGRSSKTMAKWGALHARAHGGHASAEGGDAAADQRVAQVVVVGRGGDPQPGGDTGAVGDPAAVGGGRVTRVRRAVRAAGRGELVAADDADAAEEARGVLRPELSEAEYAELVELVAGDDQYLWSVAADQHRGIER